MTSVGPGSHRRSSLWLLWVGMNFCLDCFYLAVWRDLFLIPGIGFLASWVVAVRIADLRFFKNLQANLKLWVVHGGSIYIV